MFGNVTALEGLHVTGKHRDRSMQHTRPRHAACDPDKLLMQAEKAPAMMKTQKGFVHQIVTVALSLMVRNLPPPEIASVPKIASAHPRNSTTSS